MSTDKLVLKEMRRNTSRSLGYSAFFICGISVAVLELRALFGPGGDALIGPYFTTILLVGVVGILGVIVSLFARDILLKILPKGHIIQKGT